MPDQGYPFVERVGQNKLPKWASSEYRNQSLKYELIYPGDFVSGADLFHALERYFHFYNHHRPHQALGYRTPADLYPRRWLRKRSP